MACRLIINADDFGWSPGVNQAVALLADEGIVTSASLMVGGVAAAEAVALARDRPALGVGLHVAVVCARSCLGSGKLRAMVNTEGELPGNWRAAAVRFQVLPRWRSDLRREVETQFDAFNALGLPWSHVDAHLHLSLHPVVFGLLAEQCQRYGIRAIRIPEDDYALYRRADPQSAGRWLEAQVLAQLCARQRLSLARHGLHAPQRCYGFFRSGALDERYLCRLVEEMPEGAHELHCHPDLSTESGEAEVRALLSPRFRTALEQRGVELHSRLTLARPPAADV